MIIKLPWISYSVISNFQGYFIKIPNIVEVNSGNLSFSFEKMWYFSASPTGLKSVVTHSWNALIGNAWISAVVDFQRPALYQKY